MIFDCHTHWSDDFDPNSTHDPSCWLKTLDLYGITHAIVLPTAGLFSDEHIVSDNDAVAAVCANSRGRMLPFCTVNAANPKRAMKELGRCLHQLAFRGIKFHPWVQGRSVNLPVMDEIAEAAAEVGVPILFHDGTPPFSLPSQIALLARRHPKTQVILGHSGLLEYTRESIAVVNATSNLWACLCSPHLAGLKMLIQECPSDRLLWGSDFGFSLVDLMSYRFRMMDLLGLSNAQKRAIFEVNPTRLLRVGDQPAAVR
jgi:uncharacterized protein